MAVASDDDMQPVDAQVDVGGVLEEIRIALFRLPDAFEQAGIMDRDADVIAEGLGEFGLLGRQHAVRGSGHDKHTRDRVLRPQRHRGPELHTL